jgi:hypothetical protein
MPAALESGKARLTDLFANPPGGMVWFHFLSPIGFFE